jgi:hypothetical protein
VSKVVVVKTWKRHVRVEVIQSLGACITTIGVEIVVAPIMDVVRRGILIGSIIKLGSGSGGVSTRRNLSINFTNNNYYNCCNTSNGVYQSNNDHSCEQDCRSTTNELNGCLRVQKCKCSESNRRILKTICCNYINS